MKERGEDSFDLRENILILVFEARQQTSDKSVQADNHLA